MPAGIWVPGWQGARCSILLAYGNENFAIGVDVGETAVAVNDVVSLSTVRSFQPVVVQEGEAKVVAADAVAFYGVVFAHVDRFNNYHSPVIVFSCELDFLADEIIYVCFGQWDVFHNFVAEFIVLPPRLRLFINYDAKIWVLLGMCNILHDYLFRIMVC